MSRNNSGSLTGGAREREVGGGTSRISYQTSVQLNQNDAEPVARFAEFRELLKAALPGVARQLLTDLPPSHRSESETQLLQDCARGRRDANAPTIATILDLQARGEARVRFVLSDAIRAIEAKAEPSPLGVCEASALEEATNGPLTQAQIKAHQEKSPTYWQAVREYAVRQWHATGALIESIDHQLARMA